jgi:hypothetical protein
MAFIDPDRDGTGTGIGIGGWLAFFVLVLTVFRPLTMLISTYANLYGDPNVALAYGAVWGSVQTFEWLLAVAMTLGCWYLAWRLHRIRIWRTVQITIAGVWAVSIGAQLIEAAGVVLIGGLPADLVIGVVAPMLGRGLIFGGVWTAYLLRSERVANTYPRHGETEIAEVFG